MPLALAIGATACSSLGSVARDGAKPIKIERQIEPFLAAGAKIKIFFKRIDADAPEAEWWNDESESDGEGYTAFADEARPLKLLGFFVAPDLVASVDLFLDHRYIDRIEIEDFNGNHSAASIEKFLIDRPALLFRVEEPEAFDVKRLKFAVPRKPIRKDTPLQQVVYTTGGKSISMRIRPLSPRVYYDPDGKRRLVLTPSTGDAQTRFDWVGSYPNNLEQYLGHPVVVLDRKRRPIGLAFDDRLDYEEDGTLKFLGADIAAARGYSPLEWERFASDLEARYAKWISEIRLVFRQETRESGGLFGIDFSRFMSDRTEQVPEELYVYGFPVGPRLLFVPERMERRHARALDRIEVKSGDGELEGSFAGAFTTIAAYLIEVDEDLPGYDPELFDEAPLKMGDFVLTIRPRRRFGAMDIVVGYDRMDGWEIGYGEHVALVPRSSVEAGTLYLDADGITRAVAIERRKKHEALEKLRGGKSRYFTGNTEMTEPMTTAELRPYFFDEASLLDPTIVAMSLEEAKRKRWLGIEFEAMTAELAKNLGLEGPTKGGAVGLMVSVVYPASPAERIGLRLGDVLLDIRPAEGGPTVPLREANDDFGLGFDFADLEIPPELEQFGFDFPKPAPWKSRKNLLTKMLEAIGEGTEIKLRFWRTGEGRLERQFAVEMAPHDFESAPKNKDLDVGLTVKPITYEVRAAFQLDADANRLVIAEVEQGTPAAQARLKQYDQIVAIDGKPMTDLKTYKETIAESKQRAADGESVTLRLTIENRGMTRIADLVLD